MSLKTWCTIQACVFGMYKLSLDQIFVCSDRVRKYRFLNVPARTMYVLVKREVARFVKTPKQAQYMKGVIV